MADSFQLKRSRRNFENFFICFLSISIFELLIGITTYELWGPIQILKSSNDYPNHKLKDMSQIKLLYDLVANDYKITHTI